MTKSDTPFSLKDSAIENQRPLKRLRNVDLTVYDMNDEVSGVCFAPNPYWSSLYAPGPDRLAQD
ncbi:hypothetical protein ACMFMG_008700 [Clarireedia jacksonii]